MTYEEFNEVYETYQPWIGRPIELLTANNNIGKTDYKKFILVQIKCGVSNEDRVKNEVFEPSVIIKDMVDSQIHQIPLEDFIKCIMGERQIQPVFYASKTFPNELQNNFQESEIIDTIEIIVEELVPLRENYEITIAFEKKP